MYIAGSSATAPTLRAEGPLLDELDELEDDEEELEVVHDEVEEDDDAGGIGKDFLGFDDEDDEDELEELEDEAPVFELRRCWRRCPYVYDTSRDGRKASLMSSSRSASSSSPLIT